MGDTPITRAALERVLARAAELQTAAGDQPESDAMSEAQLIELGKEVGLSPEHLRVALAEERARGEPEADAGYLTTSFLGVRTLTARRTVPGGPDAVMASIDRWMQKEESMRVKRQTRDRIVWEPRRDLVTGILRALSSKPFALSATHDVGATVAGVDGSQSVVALAADMTHTRNEILAHGISAVVVGAAATAILATLGVMTLVAALPVVVGSPLWFYGARRVLQGKFVRAHTALEQALDQLERAPGKPKAPSLLQAIESALPRNL